MQIFKTPNFNFVRWRWHAIALSLFIVLAGAAMVYRNNGLPLGVEFEGGSIVVLQFEQPPNLQQIRNALAAGMPGGDDAIVQSYGDASQRQVMVRVSEVGAESGGELSKTANLVVETLQKANIGKFTDEGREVVGPVVGQQLKRQGTLATVLALAGILVYIGLRFQFSFALGAVAATIHDLLVTLAFLVFFGYDITLNVIAAILTITGYSVNDTIVVFDRVRENMRSMRRDNLEHIVNVAVNQTLARTIITAGCTLLSVVALYLFGGEALKGFAFTMIVGIISGTYSTVFIAAAIAIMLQRGKPMKGQAAVASTPTERTPRRRARAS